MRAGAAGVPAAAWLTAARAEPGGPCGFCGEPNARAYSFCQPAVPGQKEVFAIHPRASQNKAPAYQVTTSQRVAGLIRGVIRRQIAYIGAAEHLGKIVLGHCPQLPVAQCGVIGGWVISSRRARASVPSWTEIGVPRVWARFAIVSMTARLACGSWFSARLMASNFFAAPCRVFSQFIRECRGGQRREAPRPRVGAALGGAIPPKAIGYDGRRRRIAS